MQKQKITLQEIKEGNGKYIYIFRVKKKKQQTEGILKEIQISPELTTTLTTA